MHHKRLTLGFLEMAILNVLWERGESSVAQVIAALPRNKVRHYNTCLTVLSRLVKRKLVAREEAGRTHAYRALISLDEFGRQYLEAVRHDVFGGSLRGLVAALIDPRTSKGMEQASLRRLLDEIERQEEKGG